MIFSLGGALYLTRPNSVILFALTLALTVTLLITHGTTMFVVYFCSWIALLVYMVGFSPWLYSRTLELYDFSYGIYIYSFPIGQLLVMTLGIHNPWFLFIINLVVASVLGLLSWIYIERPALRMKSQISFMVCRYFVGHNLIRIKDG